MNDRWLHGGRGVLAAAAAVAMMGARQGPPEPRAVEIHVDQYCRTVTQDDQHPAELQFNQDNRICRLSGRHDTQHWEDAPDGGGGSIRKLVGIHEQIFFLTNPLDQPVTFVVAEFVPDGWRIDSDPQPDAMEGATAIFRVHLDPRATEELHVGVRHESQLVPGL